MIQENRITNYLELLHSTLLKGLDNNNSFRMNFCPIFILNLIECESKTDLLVITERKDYVIRQLDFGFQELRKVFDYFEYDMTGVNSFKIEIDGITHTVSVIDKSNFGVYFRTSKIIYDLTEYGALNAFDL